MKHNLSLMALAIGTLVTTTGGAAAEPAQDPTSSAEAEAQRAENAQNDNSRREIEYTLFKDLTGVQDLKSGGLRYTFGPRPGGGFGFTTTAVEPSGEGVKAKLDIATGNVTYKTPDGLSVTFTTADEVPGVSTPQARLFNKPNPAGGVFGGSLTTPTVYAVPLSYTRFEDFNVVTLQIGSGASP